jgi:hypothetical protein
MYSIQAIVGRTEHLEATAERLPLVRLAQGMALIPLTQLVREAHREIPWLPFTDEGLDLVPESLGALCTNLSTRGPLAYIEAEFFGGQGTQAAILFDNAAIVRPLHVAQDAINLALRFLGVSKLNAQDEFDALSLGTHRKTEDWLLRQNRPET